MSAAGFKPAIPASERPQTHALDGAASRIWHRLIGVDGLKQSLSPTLLGVIKYFTLTQESFRVEVPNGHLTAFVQNVVSPVVALWVRNGELRAVWDQSACTVVLSQYIQYFALLFFLKYFLTNENLFSPLLMKVVSYTLIKGLFRNRSL
jgi:hypothetical protein